MNEMQSIESYAADLLARTPGLREALKKPHNLMNVAAKQRAIIGVRSPASESTDELATAAEPVIPRLLDEEIRQGAEELASFDGGTLSSQAEAVILLIGRPAMNIQSDDFGFAPDEFPELETNRATVREGFKSVGRIEVVFEGRTLMIGTGFMAGNGLIMTNRHVAAAFTRRQGNTIKLRDGMSPQIDFLRENGSTANKVFKIDEILAIHSNRDKDIAVLKMGNAITDGALPPPALSLASDPPQANDELPPANQRTIYAVGYPATDNAGTTPVTVLRSIFGSTVRVKRISPGKLTKLTKNQGQFQHDCSTLGGSSGSCVFDLQTNQVIGVHFQGVFRTANDAVSTWKFPADDLLKTFPLNFQ